MKTINRTSIELDRIKTNTLITRAALVLRVTVARVESRRRHHRDVSRVTVVTDVQLHGVTLRLANPGCG